MSPSCWRSVSLLHLPYLHLLSPWQAHSSPLSSPPSHTARSPSPLPVPHRSTRCIAEGLKSHGGHVITIEAVPLLWRQATKNLKAYANVSTLLGSPVRAGEMGGM